MATVLITGTSTGIGFATAVTLAGAGHDVCATMRNPIRAPWGMRGARATPWACLGGLSHACVSVDDQMAS